MGSVLEGHEPRESLELSIVRIGLETTELRVENETRIDTVVGGRLPLSELQQYLEGEAHETKSIARPSLVRMLEYWREGPIMCPKLAQPDEFEARAVSEYTGMALTSYTTALAKLSDLVFSPMSLAEATAIFFDPRFKLEFFTMMANCAPQRPNPNRKAAAPERPE